MIARVLAVAATVGASLPIASAFSPLSPSMGCGRAGSLQLRMGMRKDVSRRAALESVGKAAILIALAPMPALAAKGDYAKIDMRGTKSDSVSALGENDLPAAGKIDPYDNRDEANAQYGQRMQDPSLIEEKRNKALAVKEKIFTAVEDSLSKGDWRTAKLVLTRDLQALRRSMNVVSTRGKRAVSAAQKGGEPEKALDEREKAEKAFLKAVNQLAVLCDGDSPVNRKTGGVAAPPPPARPACPNPCRLVEVWTTVFLSSRGARARRLAVRGARAEARAPSRSTSSGRATRWARPPSLLLPLPVSLLYTHSVPPYRQGRKGLGHLGGAHRLTAARACPDAAAQRAAGGRRARE